ncbi:preprotein translocase subunit SecY [Candidatus Parcubacteria bacterium]|nr:MAG: preprotein translocase subunit SecY [Candidatus Parcubacteria bacterium]
MWQAARHKLALFFSDDTLLRRVGFVLFVFLLFRVLAAIPIPGVDQARLAQFFSQSDLLGFLNIFSGGGLANLSLVMLGVGPYITASIIMQLMTVVSPRLKALYSEEGEQGRMRFMAYTRWLTLPIALLQAVGFLVVLERQGVVVTNSPVDFVANVAIVVAGSFLLMWLGELATEFGIGNGVSLIIFAGIVASLPQIASQLWVSFDVAQIPAYVGLALAAIAATYAVVFITEAERPVPIVYAREARAMSARSVATYVPIRLNQAGVIPIIFALSLLVMPSILGAFLQATLAGGSFDWIAQALAAAQAWFVTGVGSIVYFIIYFLLVVGFTYFYTAITFDPQQMAKDLQHRGAFVPGVRPGEPTAEHLGSVVTRLTLVGALFLGAIAVLPFVLQYATGLAQFAVGGTALLIAVSVVLDVLRKIDAQLSVREY